MQTFAEIIPTAILAISAPVVVSITTVVLVTRYRDWRDSYIYKETFKQMTQM